MAEGPTSALALVAAYARGDLRPSEVMADALGRLGAVEAGLRAFITLNERAVAEARAADEAYRLGRQRPLEGVPLAVKDAFDTAGMRTTYGSIAFADHVPTHDAEAVRRARAAGCIVVGKTSLHELCWGITGESTIAEPARNPWALDRTAGGSSGGSAAAVAAGIVPLALGTDTGGSVRLPAALCGIVGMKPTYGRISTAGLVPLAPSLDHVGVLARDPDDAHALLEALAGQSPPRPLRQSAAGLEGISVGVTHLGATPPLDVSIAASLDEAATALRESGASVAEVEPHNLDDAHDVFKTIQLAEALESHRALGLYPTHLSCYSPELVERLRLAERMSTDELQTARRRRESIDASLAAVFESFDVLLSPAVPCAAPPVERRTVEAGASFRALVMPFTVVQSLAGVPACVVRAGMDALGLPLAVQITGTRGADDVVLEVARSLYAETAALQESWPPMVARGTIDSIEGRRRRLTAAQKSTPPTIQAGANRLGRRNRCGY